MSYTKQELQAARRRHDASQRQINSLNDRIGRLIQSRSDHERIIADARLIMEGIKPCRMCKRLVKSPCHDVASYHENGPWDGHCREMFR